MRRPQDVPNTPAPPTPARTLTALAHDAGPSDPKLLADLLDGADTAELIAQGRQISSARIVTDTRRLYAEALDFWQRATPEQHETLRGFSPALLSLAIHQALHLETLAGRRDDKVHAQHATQSVETASEANATTAGLLLRDQAHTVLLQVAGRDATLRASVDAAVGTATTGDELAHGLERLAAIAREFARHHTGPIASRARLARLDAGYIASLDAAAKAVRAHATPQAPVPGGKTDQAELDRNDGINLHLLSQIVHAFESAHDRDPTIPRLVPIATRRLLGTHTHVAAAPPAAPKPPAVAPPAAP